MPAPVRLLIAGTFINKLGGFILPYLSLVLLRDFHLTPGEVGLLLASYGVGAIVAIVAGGFLADLVGRRRTLLLSLGGSGLLAIAMSFAPSPRVFVVLLLVFGFLADLYRPAASAIIGDLLPGPQRAVGFAALRTAVNLGFCLGVVLGGLLADVSWRALFLGDGVTTLVYGGIVAFSIAETRPGTAEKRDGPVGGSAPDTSPWRDTVFLQLCTASLALCLVFCNFLSVLPLTMTVSAGYPARVFGALMAVNGLLIATFEISVIEAVKRFRRLRVAALGVLLTGLGFALTGATKHWPGFLGTVLIWTAGEILAMPTLSAFVADWAPPLSRGRYLGLYQATWSVAFALNPAVALPLYARLGDAAFWPTQLLLAVPASLLLLRLDRRADRPERLRGLQQTE